MAIQRYNPFHSLTPLDEPMLRLFPRRFRNMPRVNPNFALLGGNVNTLPMDAFYTDESLILKAAAPGFKADDVDLSINGNWLVLKGKKETEDSDDKRFVLKERGFDAFHRAMRLPKGLHAEKAEASFQDGILTITIPRSEDTKPQTHNIPINS